MYDRSGFIKWTSFNSIADVLKDILGRMNLPLDHIVHFVRTLYTSMSHSIPDAAISFLDMKKGVYQHIFFIQSLGAFPSLLDLTLYDNNNNNNNNNNKKIENKDENENKDDNKNNNDNDNNNDDNEKENGGITISIQNQKIIDIQNQKKKKTNGFPIIFGHEHWELVLNILLGIRKSLTAPLSTLSFQLRLQQIEKYFLLPVGNSLNSNNNIGNNNNNNNNVKWEIEDYSPKIFQGIRDHFKVNQSEYELTFSPESLIGNLLIGKLKNLRTFSNSGRGGGVFFSTENGKYFVKTIPDEELLLFRKILGSYYDHILSYPNTLITRFYGLYRIRQSTANNWMSFVVMENLFVDPQALGLALHETYDLKGSTVNRNAKIDGNVDRSTYALKDNDFKRSINVGPRAKAVLLQQVECDTRWMESHNICDYSLLVGFHSREYFGEDDEPFDKYVIKNFQNQKPNQSSIFRQFNGGMLSLDCREIYFIGIIDILTEFNFKKKSEKIVKSLYYDASKISAMEPTPYRRRYVKYVSSILD